MVSYIIVYGLRVFSKRSCAGRFEYIRVARQRVVVLLLVCDYVSETESLFGRLDTAKYRTVGVNRWRDDYWWRWWRRRRW